MSLYLHHVTLNTGHVARQTRDMVTDRAVAVCSDLLDAAIPGGHPALPHDDGAWLLNATTHGRALIATLWRGPWEMRTAILTMGVAPKSRVSLPLWRIMHGQAPTTPSPQDATAPRAPWAADRLEPGAEKHLGALRWTGDFSRSLAWAWMEYDR